jgi:hypothetical protein
VTEYQGFAYLTESASISDYRDLDAMVDSKLFYDEATGNYTCGFCNKIGQHKQSLKYHVETHFSLQGLYHCILFELDILKLFYNSRFRLPS